MELLHYISIFKSSLGVAGGVKYHFNWKMIHEFRLLYFYQEHLPHSTTPLLIKLIFYALVHIYDEAD